MSKKRSIKREQKRRQRERERSRDETADAARIAQWRWADIAHDYTSKPHR